MVGSPALRDGPAMTRLPLPAALLALAASTAASAAPANAPPPAALSLAETAWTFSSIDGQRPVSADTQLHFDADSFDATVGCNGMGSDWRLDGTVLVSGPIISTQRYCEGVMEQERAVGALLAARPVLSIENGRLVIAGAGHRAVLVRAN